MVHTCTSSPAVSRKFRHKTSCSVNFECVIGTAAHCVCSAALMCTFCIVEVIYDRHDKAKQIWQLVNASCGNKGVKPLCWSMQRAELSTRAQQVFFSCEVKWARCSQHTVCICSTANLILTPILTQWCDFYLSKGDWLPVKNNNNKLLWTFVVSWRYK